MPVYRPLEGEILQVSKYQSIAHADEADNISFAVQPVSAAGDKFRAFQPIDFGKPLSILIRKIYTGRFPEKHLFSSQKPMLVSSAIRDITTTSAGARALNVLKKAVDPGSVFSGSAADEDGTSLVYYSPAMASPFVTITLTMIFEDFPQELFDRASTLFGSLAGVPIFAPAMGYLLGASTVIKLTGNIGSQILNGHPALSENIQLDFSFGGGVMPTPGFWILSSGTVDTSKYQFDPNKGLIDKSTSSPYDGPDPIIVMTVDGGKVDGITNFTPLLAGASVLGRFFNQKDGSEVAMDTALDAVKLLNDLTYRKKAEETKARLASLPDGSPDRQKLQDALKAFNTNIGESRLKLADS
jgi:hypothetical protein